MLWLIDMSSRRPSRWSGSCRQWADRVIPHQRDAPSSDTCYKKYIHVLENIVERGSSVVECWTRNREPMFESPLLSF